MKNNKQINIGFLQGFLKAFQLVNRKVNHSFIFTLEVFDKEGKDLYEAMCVQDYFKDNPNLELEQIHENDLLSLIEDWLFQFLYIPQGAEAEAEERFKKRCLQDVKERFSISKESFRKEVLAEWWKNLEEALPTEEAYIVQNINSNTSLGVQFDFIIFEGKTDFAILRFSWSD